MGDMPDVFVIPPVPVLLSLGVVLMGACWWFLRRRGPVTGRQLVTAWAACWYLVAVIGLTIFPFRIRLGGHHHHWSDFVIAIPIITINPVDFVLNVLMTVPLGVLLPLLTRIDRVRQIAKWALVSSAIVETTQLLSNLLIGGGRTADVNDLLANTTGAVLGFLLYRRLARRPGLDRFHLAPGRTDEDGVPLVPPARER
jgi:glycopeptide antibiotics resistance protein